jgi:hypothetical protein
LQLPVEARVPLFHAARIPGHIEVKQVMTVCLQIGAFARRIRREQDTHWMFRRFRVEGGLDLVAARCGPAERFYPRIGFGQFAAELPLQIVQRISTSVKMMIRVSFIGVLPGR